MVKQRRGQVNGDEAQQDERRNPVQSQDPAARRMVGGDDGRQREQVENAQRRKQLNAEPAEDRDHQQQPVQRPVRRAADAPLPRLQAGLQVGCAPAEAVDQPRADQQKDDDAQQLVRTVDRIRRGIPDVQP